MHAVNVTLSRVLLASLATPPLLPPLFTYRLFIYRLPVIPRIQGQLEGHQQKDLRRPATHMPRVTDGVSELESPTDGLEQVGIQTAADLLPPKVGNHDARR